MALREAAGPADDPRQLALAVPGEVGRGAEALRRRIEPDLAEAVGERADRRVVERHVERREVDAAELPGEPRRVLAQPRVGARDGGDDLLDLGAHVVVRLVRVPPHVVFDRAVVRRRARHSRRD